MKIKTFFRLTLGKLLIFLPLLFIYGIASSDIFFSIVRVSGDPHAFPLSLYKYTAPISDVIRVSPPLAIVSWLPETAFKMIFSALTLGLVPLKISFGVLVGIEAIYFYTLSCLVVFLWGRFIQPSRQMPRVQTNAADS